MQHNVMAEHEHSEEAHEAPKVADPNVLAGPMLSKDQSYYFVFNKILKDLYHCAPHPWMQGIIEVVD